ncbi:hypothetical protein CC1G_12809 [Coprinopsis cinerea okayama7|uniref:Uncharacterized protein n=1 Tax=Coprinopsis cinerea (strain Okayama-7 / 130 / ATCC MYA-4618 / FGSC 9003) TaxID=240176 RepID=A8P909_COPC7|nr:hypothetical protein CC1G_12809 [Coprinopsis cinerea okayama7\|eukprot:XP_001839674.2 hypothetical protein CC1G_12809 [Coprinopsis cinerea okayama7\
MAPSASPSYCEQSTSSSRLLSITTSTQKSMNTNIVAVGTLQARSFQRRNRSEVPRLSKIHLDAKSSSTVPSLLDVASQVANWIRAQNRLSQECDGATVNQFQRSKRPPGASKPEAPLSTSTLLQA